ncbi:MAG TPA: beta-agarase [Candidatus Paceibacterota bacterium]|nr:beta-agarase [Verrucomicrobiota bacterium]HRZ44074.1 beta-agarase [Candidatus Paceibacterota bacterium]
MALALAVGAAGSAAEQVLWDFTGSPPATVVQTTDATASASGGRLRVTTGTAEPWPGVALAAPGGKWDLAAFGHIAVDLKNAGTNRVAVSCRADNPGADGTKGCVTGSLALNPGQSGTLRVTIRRSAESRLEGRLFGMRGYPHGPGDSGVVDPKNIVQLLLFVNRPSARHIFEVGAVRAAGAYTPPTAWVTDADPFFPFIDTFGQYKHKEWPGKAHSVPELRMRREQEAKELAADPGPEGWCEYGGWAAGPRQKATGFFRAEKVDGRWWLVDPDGHLFWSHGIDCVRMIDTTPIDERQAWFEAFPGAEPAFKEFLSKGFALKGHYAGKTPECYAFAAANMKRKYGGDWRAAYADTAHRRLRHWGLNTIANWSDSDVFLMRRTPYTDNIGSSRARRIEGSGGYWGKFPDVYDPTFREGIRRSMEGKQGGSASDPWCIGYFSDNEMSWGDDTSLAVAASKSPPDQPAKRQFIADLEAKYGGIGGLNAAWGTEHASWEALRELREAPDPSKARADLVAFYARTAETYFREVRAAIREVAPNQLYLGCRFAWVNEVAAKAAARQCDVVSYNLYRRSIADFEFPGGDKPLIVGEFHFGALDRGMFHTGLVPVENQAARAQAYRDYVLGAARHPLFVGTHWFQWKDEPTTGRVYDEENYQIGFLDVADTPYRETIEASRAAGEAIYLERIGRR